jgi:type I restriction enzyme S subunit
MKGASAALVPKLRFPGFNLPWAYDPLSKVLKEEKLKNTQGRAVFSVSMEYGIVNQIELLGRSYAAADTSHYTIGRRYDVVYTKSPLKAFPFGIVKQCKFDGEVALSPLYGVFTPPNQHVGLMIEAYFEAPNRSKDFLAPLCQKGAKNTLQITNTTFLSGRLPLPTQPAEQRKIASCLSSLDDLITAQARRVEALKKYKKGLMQQLFPREGETQPRLRFPEFRGKGEWEEVVLGEIAEIKLGKMLDKQKHTTGHLLPYLNNLAVRWNEVNTSDLPKMYFNDGELDRFGLRAGDVVVCEGGEPGRAAVWDGRLPDLKFQKAIHRVRFNVPFEPKILVLHLENLAGTTAFEMLFTGGGIKHLTGETFSRLKIPLISHAEQHRIASSLTSLDDVITAQIQKLQALKTHKKGLMQGLFPAAVDIRR